MSKRHPRKILVVLDYCHTGEVVRIGAYVAAVREHYPDASITALVNEGSRDALAGLQIFDKIVVSRLYYDRPPWRLGVRFSKAREMARILRELGIGYDLVINFYWGTTALRCLGYLVCRGERVGFAKQPTWLLTTYLGPFYRHEPTHTQQHLALLHAAGINVDFVAKPCAFASEEDNRRVEALLRERGIGPDEQFIVLHAGSDWACQQWLAERWVELADELVRRYGATVVFTGATSEEGYVEDIRERMTEPSISLVGETTLVQLAPLLGRSRLCVCVDSAPFEMTQAADIPAVVLAGSTSPQTVVPGRRLPVIVNRMEPKMADTINDCRGLHFTQGGCLNYACPMSGLREITVADVLQAVEEQMQARDAQGASEVVPSAARAEVDAAPPR